MTNAEKQLTKKDRTQLSNRIASLEQRTDAEVVCAVATESGRYDRAESICGLFVSVFTLMLAQQIFAINDWDVTVALPIGWQMLFIVVGFVAGSVLASYWYGLRRLFVSRKEMASEVERSVLQVFAAHGIGGTRHHGGLLIYVSLFERQLEIHCDRTLTEKLSTDDLKGIRDAVLEKVRIGQVTDGLIAGLNKAEELLAVVLPQTAEVNSGLENEVLVFHPRP